MACTGGEKLLSESEERFRGKRRPRKDGPIILTLDLSHSLIQSLIPPYGHSINVPAAAVRLKGRAAQQRRRRPIRGKIPAMIGNGTVFAAAAASVQCTKAGSGVRVRPSGDRGRHPRPSDVGRSIFGVLKRPLCRSTFGSQLQRTNERTNEPTNEWTTDQQSPQSPPPPPLRTLCK